MRSVSLVTCLVIVFLSCESPKTNPREIVNKSIEAHGGNILDSAKVKFTFRDKDYSLNRKGYSYIYTRSFDDSLGYVTDSLVNSKDLSRYVNDSLIDLSEEWENKYANSVNSVLYFSQLPYVLNDPAVNLEYVAKQQINGEEYHSIKVYFDKESGGEDFDDEYRYWIHSKDYTVDYLAYNYHTEGGGTRFRKAIDRQNIQGIVFQNYINYAPEEKFPPLDSLPILLENGQLKELSRIENKNIEVIN